jgi:predicted Rossmann fold flavoprotein
MTYDKIIIGGGPSGMMAAIASSLYGFKTLLIDKNKKLGKKLRMTGGGRCNVTNNGTLDDIIANIPGNGRFLYSVFSQFDNHDIINFFQENGVKLKEEDHGRMFPATDKSATIVDALVAKMRAQGVELMMNTEVLDVKKSDDRFVVKTSNGSYESDKVIVATGGKTYPSTGSNGFGLEIARRFGHHITALTPSESPLIMTHPLKDLQGISLRDVGVSVGKTRIIHDLLFTHFGLSGPAALRASTYIQPGGTLSLDLFPDRTVDNLLNDWLSTPDKAIKNALKGDFQERVLLYLLNQAGMDPNLKVSAYAEKNWQDFAHLCKNWDFAIEKTFSLEKSFVTKGGVDLKEIDPKSLQSKLVPGLYFTGEVLDINAHTGGFNITAALCTGWVAGTQYE